MSALMEKVIPITKGIPSSETSERSLISCLLQNFPILDRMSLPEDLFLNPAHKTILAAIKKLHAAGTKTDFFAVQSELERDNKLESVGGPHGLTEILMVMTTGDFGIAEWHRNQLAEATRYRKALALVRGAEHDLINRNADIAALSAALADYAAGTNTPHPTTGELIQKLTVELEKKEPVQAFGTGIPALDRATNGGVKRGELLTVAAPTSGGKSILLAQLAHEAIRNNRHTIFFSLEMSAVQVTARLLSAMCDFNIGVLRASIEAPKTERQLLKFHQQATLLSKCPLQIISGVTDMETIDSITREYHAKGMCDLAIADYIQLIHLRNLGSNETREQHVSEITKRLKTMALQLNIGVATASQLNDEGKLRESRAIAHHSDHVWLICEGQSGQFININKNRDGERGGSIPVTMKGDISKFATRENTEE